MCILALRLLLYTRLKSSVVAANYLLRGSAGEGAQLHPLLFCCNNILEGTHFLKLRGHVPSRLL